MRRGQPRRISVQGDPGGARRRPLLRYLGAGLGGALEELPVPPDPLHRSASRTGGLRRGKLGVGSGTTASASREGRGNRPYEAFGNLPPGKVPNPVGPSPKDVSSEFGRRRGGRPNPDA